MFYFMPYFTSYAFFLKVNLIPIRILIDLLNTSRTRGNSTWRKKISKSFFFFCQSQKKINFCSRVVSPFNKKLVCPVDLGCRIHRLLLCGGVKISLNEFPGYDTKQSDGEVPVMPELLGMRSTSLLPSLPVPLLPGVVALDRVLSMGQIGLNCTYAKLNCSK